MQDLPDLPNQTSTLIQLNDNTVTMVEFVTDLRVTGAADTFRKHPNSNFQNANLCTY